MRKPSQNFFQLLETVERYDIGVLGSLCGTVLLRGGPKIYRAVVCVDLNHSAGSVTYINVTTSKVYLVQDIIGVGFASVVR